MNSPLENLSPSSTLSEVTPMVKPAIKLVTALIKVHLEKRLEIFLKAAELDESFLSGLHIDEWEQKLFIEYAQRVADTPNPLACATLAFIFRDNSLGHSLKSLCANSFSGISVGTLNVFISVMQKLEAPTTPEEKRQYDSLINTNQGTVNISPKTVISKDQIEVIAFSNDLVSRNFCSKAGGVLGDDGSYLSINAFSLLLYKYLKIAQEKKMEWDTN